jgi:thiol-disulfide isomerase/thioredoxin
MSAALLAARLILVAVLVLAGIGKLADRQGARQAVRAFGVPEILSAPVATVLPFVELAAAALLVPSATAELGAGLALALVLVFSGAITRSLLRGETPDCHCFGALHSEPAGLRTLIRNLALAAVAGLSMTAGPGASATHWVTTLNSSAVVILILAVGLTATAAAAAAFALHLLRRNGELLLRVDELETVIESSGLAVPVAEPAPDAGLPVGTPAPDFELSAVNGERVTLAGLRAGGGELLLLFTDPGCGPCNALMPQVAEWQRERPGNRRLVVVSRGGAEANAAHATQHGLSDILIQPDREVSERYAVTATPSALIVGVDGAIASAVHAGEEEIRRLVDQRADGVLRVHRGGAPVPAVAPAPTAPGAGHPAPDPMLRTLEGKLVRLSQKLPSGPALIVFWNPGCGFCQRMLEQLRELDAPDSGLVVISTGEPQSNREMGLRAPVLLDDSFSADSAFGAAGTPSAVLIDEHRRLASAVAVGAEAVLALGGQLPAAVAA